MGKKDEKSTDTKLKTNKKTASTSTSKKYDVDKFVEKSKENLKKLPARMGTQLELLNELKTEITELINKGHSFNDIAKAISDDEIKFLPRTLSKIFSTNIKIPFFFKEDEVIILDKNTKKQSASLQKISNKEQFNVSFAEMAKGILSNAANKEKSVKMWNWAQDFVKKQP